MCIAKEKKKCSIRDRIDKKVPKIKKRGVLKMETVQSLKSKVIKTVKEIEKLKKRRVNLLGKSQKECSHSEVLTTSYANDFYTETASLCTGCGLHVGAQDGHTSASRILNSLLKKALRTRPLSPKLSS